jgi:hypothetical protein
MTLTLGQRLKDLFANEPFKAPGKKSVALKESAVEVLAKKSSKMKRKLEKLNSLRAEQVKQIAHGANEREKVQAKLREYEAAREEAERSQIEEQRAFEQAGARALHLNAKEETFQALDRALQHLSPEIMGRNYNIQTLFSCAATLVGEELAREYIQRIQGGQPGGRRPDGNPAGE